MSKRAKQIIGAIGGIVGFIASVIGIYAWITGKNLPDVMAAVNTKSVASNTLAVGDTILFGRRLLAHRWQVLDVQEGRALIIFEKTFLKLPYNDGNETVSWADCTLRAYLNGDFFSIYFSAKQQARIIETALGDTKDFIFLLSEDEANHYFLSDNDRISKYMFVPRKPADWWLRSDYPGTVSRTVSVEGAIRGYTAVEESRGVRPALWLKLT